MNRPSNGLEYLFKGFRLICQPGIRHFVIIPLIINILVFSLMLGIAIHYFGQFSHWVMGFLPHWLAWLSYILWTVFTLVFVFFMVYSFTLVANIVAAPFNSFLAEKVELYLSGSSFDEQTNWRSIWREVSRTVGRELRKLVYYLPRAIILLILFLIPLINMAASFIWLAFSVWLMNIQYMDYPMDNHKIPFTDMRKRLSKKRVTGFSFGASVLLFSSVPIVNFFVMPAAVAGATAIWVDKFKN